ncbi:hypothetical protein BJY16_006519 [Actinoplanes octamycinicus]|uniref:Transcriptional regulator SbtR-like C-terminal domain-containing protein n=1 Tax=Actinoplanes octamycinicus TaxID=135948 RepID=A0A7W7H315_9ACTN|nr:hypothetical protein [Actinoplanes octamycinicus]MBB4743060.1 hypothetical protein [Actinoplanes octamycinicus]GIE61376.1 hypothetical protein Aoc01nite_67780 [Actinoplanes octamycinicus]
MISTAPDQDATASTTAHREKFLASTRTVLDRARQAGILHPDLTEDDLHRLVCGTAFALRIGADPTDRLERYLQVLLDSIRAGHP